MHKRLLLVETPSHPIVIGIPGGWSLVWNEKFTIVWFSTLAQGSHVFDNFSQHTEWVETWWLVVSWDVAGIPLVYREGGWRV